MMLPQQPPAPPAPPAAEATPAVAPTPPATLVPAPITLTVQGGNPAQSYQAAVNQRRELARIRSGLDDERRSLVRQLQSAGDGANREGLEARLQLIDRRILALEHQMSQSDALVASMAGVTGAIPPPPPEPLVDDDLVGFLAVFAAFGVVLPLTVAHVRRIWKRGGQAVSAIPAAVQDRLARLEQNVDAIAIEMERVSEGQRFMTKLFAEQEKRPQLEQVEPR